MEFLNVIQGRKYTQGPPVFRRFFRGDQAADESRSGVATLLIKLNQSLTALPAGVPWAVSGRHESRRSGECTGCRGDFVRAKRWNRTHWIGANPGSWT